MIIKAKNLINEWIPPIFRRLYYRSIRRVGYFDNYPTWEAARKASTGYDSNLILERVRDAQLKIKNGEAVYERDSVIFDKVQYSWPLLAALLWIASQNGNRLSIIDFGGSLGSSYFQNRSFLKHLAELHWSIVEQEKFVQCGCELFADETLHFYNTVDECMDEKNPDTVLLSSVLPYLEHPYDLLAEIIEKGFDYIIIDRTPLINGTGDRLTVQRVPPEIYEACYSAWMLSKQKLFSIFSKDYELIVEFDALAGVVDLGDDTAHDKGFILRKKQSVLVREQ